MRHVWLAIGLLSVGLGAIGILLPLLPTVPFMILAAFCFARANPAWEARLLTHPLFGRHIRAWRERGAISAAGKAAATLALAGSAAAGLYLLDGWTQWLPLGVAMASGAFILTRPTG